MDTARGAVNATIQEKTFREDIVLHVANQNRAVLGGRSISSLLSKDLKIGLTPPTVVSGELREYLEQRLYTAQVVDLKDDLPLLQSWLGDLQGLSSALSAAVDKYPEATSEQTAWDTLTRLEENLKALGSAETSFTSAELSQERANILLDSFLRARDNVLENLYDNIRDRFVDLYRQLHQLDEGKFTAKIKPEEAGLNFEVDFYGRGTHPPLALHSEGHQDSMGLCLYLALAEHLTKGLIDLIILDDVVMSVDTDHRRPVCHLLATFFPNRQFLITTHDKTWANQLKSEGVVTSRATVEK